MKMKLTVWTRVSCVVAGLAALLAGCPGADVVVIPDRGLELAIRAELSQPFGFLTRAGLLDLDQLDARNRGITNLTGLEYCLNLQWLNLAGNNISDITSITPLVNLTYLNVEANDLSELGPLAGLFYLQTILLFDNGIRDLGPLITNATNGGVGDGTLLWLGEEVLNEQNAHVQDQIAQLESFGVTVVVAASGSGSSGQ